MKIMFFLVLIETVSSAVNFLSFLTWAEYIEEFYAYCFIGVALTLFYCYPIIAFAKMWRNDCLETREAVSKAMCRFIC